MQSVTVEVAEPVRARVALPSVVADAINELARARGVEVKELLTQVVVEHVRNKRKCKGWVRIKQAAWHKHVYFDILLPRDVAEELRERSAHGAGYAARKIIICWVASQGQQNLYGVN